MDALARENRDRSLIEMYLQGARIADIAEEFDLSNLGVSQILRRHNIKRDPSFKPEYKYRKKIEITDDQVIKLWNSGLSVKLISERYGVHKCSIHAIAKRLGLIDPRNPRHTYSASAGGGSGRSGFAGSFARKT